MKKSVTTPAKNAIFMVFDDLYFYYFRACINSLRQNYPDYPTLLICYSGTSDLVKQFISEIPRAVQVPLQSLDKNYAFLQNVGEVNSPLIYQRYRLWTTEFKAYDNILHLDVDTLVLKSLVPFFKQKNFFIVRNNNPEPFSHIFNKPTSTGKLQAMLAEDGIHKLNDQDALGNAGLFLIPKKHRTKKQFQELVTLTTKYLKYFNYSDQSAISLWCAKNHITVESNFLHNLQTLHLFAPEIARAKPSLLEKVTIVHFSFLKPDMKGYTKFLPPIARKLKSLFFHYLFLDVPVLPRYLVFFPRYLFFKIQKLSVYYKTRYNPEDFA